MMITEWNNSRLTSLQMCGERFRRREIEGEPEASTPSMIRGSTVHAVAKIALRRKLGGKPNTVLPTIEEARDLAATDFEGRWGAQEIRLVVGDDEDGAEMLSQAKAESKDFVVAQAAFYVSVDVPGIGAGLATRLRPVAVERKIIVAPRDSDLKIHGTLDVVTRPEEPVTLDVGLDPILTASFSRDTIRDLKTSTKSPNRSAADNSQQLSMYAMIRAAEVGDMPDALALDYLIRTPKRGDLKAVELRATRDAEDTTALVARINAAVEAVKRGVFLPADPNAWWCSEKACGFWTSCPYVRRSRRPTS